MKIGLYLQNGGQSLGGSEYWLACLAKELSRENEVTILHHKVGLTLDQLAAFAGFSLSRVQACNELPQQKSQWSDLSSSVSDRSEAFDLFVTITHVVPPICRAKVGVLIVLFPLEPLPHEQLFPWSEAEDLKSGPRALVRAAYYSWRWRRQFGGYQVRASLSGFAQKWVHHAWNINTSVLYPPGDTSSTDEPKDSLIVSVGRFSVGGATAKGQLDLLRLFISNLELQAPEWTYATIGAFENGAGDREYLERVKSEARGHRIQVIEDAGRAHLKSTLARAKIFWHGVGFNVDEARAPHRCEHFGLVTVEAMAAGAVPIVIGRGGQREIVRHGVDGFLCDTLNEMAHYTRVLIENPGQLAAMSEETRRRAEDFSTERSLERFKTLVGPRCSIPA